MTRRRAVRTEAERAARRARLKKWAPTIKWWVATITAGGTLAGLLWVGDGINTDEEKLVVIGLVTQRLVAYVSRN